jgi:sulfopropanediol 3-dehydrogenase
VEYLKHADMPTDEDRAALATQVTELLDDLRTRGEPAVRALSARFDDWSPEDFRVPDA